MLRLIDRVTGALASLFLFLLMIITFIDVLGRNLFNHPLIGASEITEILLASVIFVMLPPVALRQMHIVIDLVDNFSSPPVRRALDIFGALLGSAMFALIAVQVWRLGAQAIRYGDTTPALKLPLAPVFYLISILSFVTAVAFLVVIARVVRENRGGSDAYPGLFSASTAGKIPSKARSRSEPIP